MKSRWWLISLLVCLAVVSLSPLASSSPDGLERVAVDKGFMVRTQAAPFQIMADYVFPGIENEAAATIIAGLIGTFIVFGVVYSLAWLLRLRKRKTITKGGSSEAQFS